ncbi:MAG: hypothetical protein V4628_11600 [Pseudomonadota bacterium]
MMSDAMAKRERSMAKDARQLPAPDRSVGRLAQAIKRARPIVIEHKCIEGSVSGMFGPKDWSAYGSYRDLKTAMQAMDGFKRKYSFYEYRIKPAITSTEGK